MRLKAGLKTRMESEAEVYDESEDNIRAKNEDDRKCL